jgi:hypothetical protein
MGHGTNTIRRSLSVPCAAVYPQEEGTKVADLSFQNQMKDEDTIYPDIYKLHSAPPFFYLRVLSSELLLGGGKTLKVAWKVAYQRAATGEI